MNFFEKFYVYVDDEREPLMDYDYWAKNYTEAISAIETFCTQGYTSLTLDLDHDLGIGKTGYDIAKWCVEHGWKGTFRVHTMNPVGHNNICQLLHHYGWTEIF